MCDKNNPKRSYRMINEGTAFLLQSLRNGSSNSKGNDDSASSDSEEEESEEKGRKGGDSDDSSSSTTIKECIPVSSVSVISENNKNSVSSQQENKEEEQHLASTEQMITLLEGNTSSTLEPSTGDSKEESTLGAVRKLTNLDFASPKLLCSVKKPFACHTGSPQKYGNNNFLKGCKWSPDGSCILTNSEDRTLRVFTLKSETFAELNSGNMSEFSEETDVGILSENREGDLVYDFCWFPLLYGIETNSCLYATTSRDHPIHLRDAFSGAPRATYRPINHLVSDHSV